MSMTKQLITIMDDQQDLWEAVTKKKIDILKQKWKKDPTLLYKCKLGCFDQSILHIVTSHNSLEDVKDILSLDPELAQVLDSRGWSPLHVAAANGHTHVLQELIPCSLRVARLKTENGDTILHLCVEQNRLDTLKMLINNIKNSEFANRKDPEGNTILHLAVILGHSEIVEYLLKNRIVNLFAINRNENTALDIAHINKFQEGMTVIENLLKTFGALRTKHLNGGQWLIQKRDTLMVVASLMATMAFQAGVSPPGGVWQDNLTQNNTVVHKAGEAVMAFNYPVIYLFFSRFNAIGFIGSLSTILLLLTGLPFRKKIMMWILVVIMWATISAMAVTYAFSVSAVTPNEVSLGGPIVFGEIVWGCVIVLLLVWHGLVLLNKWLHHKNVHSYPNFFSKFFLFCTGSMPEHPPTHSLDVA